MRKKIFLLLVFLTTNLLAQNDWKQLALEANKLYEEKNYAQAIDKYQQLLAMGAKNAEVYYDLGNSYFKDHQLGKARLCYERAWRLSPQDEDIIYNLNYVRSLIKEPALTFWETLYNAIAFPYLTYLTSGFYFGFAILLCVFILRKGRFLFYSCLFLGGILFFLSLWWLGQFYSQEMVKTAVVINTSAEVRNGPGEDFSLGFTIPEGKKVLVMGERNGWYEIGLKKEGLKGWLLKSSLENI